MRSRASATFAARATVTAASVFEWRGLTHEPAARTVSLINPFEDGDNSMVTRLPGVTFARRKLGYAPEAVIRRIHRFCDECHRITTTHMCRRDRQLRDAAIRHSELGIRPSRDAVDDNRTTRLRQCHGAIQQRVQRKNPSPLRMNRRQ